MIQCVERFGSRERGSKSAKLLYVIFGTTDGDDAYAALADVVPNEYGPLVLSSIQPVERQGVDFWFGEAEYGENEDQTEGASYEFDTGGGTQHITQGLALLSARAAPGFSVPESFGAIGVSRDRVEGCDIVVPQYHFSVKKYLDKAIVQAAYKNALCSLTGTINQGAWEGYADGTVLFLGATGSMRISEDDWELTFKYAASPDQEGLEIGSITGVDKPGWAYLWVRYEDTADDGAKAMVKKPIAAYVNQVYRKKNWSGILSL